jgi:hypothetical protein
MIPLWTRGLVGQRDVGKPSEAEWDRLERYVHIADVEHEAMSRKFVSCIILAISAEVVPKSIVSGGRYWLIFCFHTVLVMEGAVIVTRLTIMNGMVISVISLSDSTGCRRGTLKVYDIGREAKHKRLEVLNASV